MKLSKILLVLVFTLSVLHFGCKESEKTHAATTLEDNASQKETVDLAAQQPASPAPESKPKEAAKTQEKTNDPIVTGQGPKIQTEKEVHNFGETGPKQTYHCEFSFKNVGDAPLVVERIQSTCGCTVPKLDKKRYAPGEEGTIKVSFQTPTRKGPVAKHLYIHSNDPSNPKYELTVKATVVMSVELEPERLQLSLKMDPEKTPTVKITSKDGKPFRITSFKDSRKSVSATLDPEVEATEFELPLEINLAGLARMPNGAVTIELTHPNTKSLYLPYSANPLYEVDRPRIILRDAEPGEKTTKTVWVRSNYNESIQIASTESQKGLMQIVSQDRKDETSIKLDVEITPPDGEGASRYFTDTLTIKLENGETLYIRCSGWFRRTSG